MKTVKLLVILLGTTFLINGQTKLYKGNNILMPTNIIVSYPISLKVNNEITDSLDGLYYSNQQIKDVFPIIINTALSGKVPVYSNDNFNNYYILDNEKLGDSLIKNKLGFKADNPSHLDNFSSILFWDEFEATTNPFSFSKKVIGYSPVREFYSVENNWHKYATTILVIDTQENKKLIDESNKRMVLVQKIKYEYFLYADVNFTSSYKENFQTYYNLESQAESNGYEIVKGSSPFLNPIGIQEFIHSIYIEVTKKNRQAYDFETNRLLTIDEIKAKLGEGVETVKIPNYETGELISKGLKIDFDVNSVQSVIFSEEWYIDPLTLRMQKKVIAISPVIFPNNDSPKERRIAFTVYFDEKK